MRKIIKGKKYDTQTAQEIACHRWWDDSVCYRQRETFYLKKTGEFFRHDEKRTTWGNIYEYEDIIPLTEEQARDQLEAIVSVRKFELIFGEVAE